MFEAELKMHRTWFSLLCDPGYRQLLDERQRAAVDRYLPYSVDLRPENLDEALADKDGYVFKRSYSYGGQGVVLGADRTRDELRQALLADGVEAWACQRRVQASTVDLPGPDGRVRPHHLVLGMYVYGDRSSGLLVRGSAASPVVNASRGGGVSWAFVG